MGSAGNRVAIESPIRWWIDHLNASGADASSSVARANRTSAAVGKSVLTGPVLRAGDPSGLEVEVLRTGDCPSIGRRLLQPPLIAECSHINSQTGEAGEDNEGERDTDDHLAGLFIHFHSDLHLEELNLCGTVY
jgi:hypothetical protein